jgi:hypothetical protein
MLDLDIIGHRTESYLSNISLLCLIVKMLTDCCN